MASDPMALDAIDVEPGGIGPDRFGLDRFGPDGISNLIKNISSLTVKFQNGFIYHYAFIMLLGFSALLTFLILK